jgi:hypothetical protein
MVVVIGRCRWRPGTTTTPDRSGCSCGEQFQRRQQHDRGEPQHLPECCGAQGGPDS